jgi:cytochrome c oxidase cbb3-type subunit 1
LLFLAGAVVASYNIWMTIRMSRQAEPAAQSAADMPAALAIVPGE